MRVGFFGRMRAGRGYDEIAHWGTWAGVGEVQNLTCDKKHMDGLNENIQISSTDVSLVSCNTQGNVVVCFNMCAEATQPANF